MNANTTKNLENYFHFSIIILLSIVFISEPDDITEKLLILDWFNIGHLRSYCATIEITRGRFEISSRREFNKFLDATGCRWNSVKGDHMKDFSFIFLQYHRNFTLAISCSRKSLSLNDSAESKRKFNKTAITHRRKRGETSNLSSSGMRFNFYWQNLFLN